MSGRKRKPVQLDFFENVKPSKPKQKKTKALKVTTATVSTSINTTTPSWVPAGVTLSSRDKASQLDLSNDQFVCTGVEVGRYLLIIIKRRYMHAMLGFVKCGVYSLDFE